MSSRRTILLWNGAAVAVLLAMAVLVVHRFRFFKPFTIQGAVMAENADSRKELPIADVEITVANGMAQWSTKSDASGYFHLQLRPGIRRGRPITLQFSHPNYEPLDMREYVSDKLYIAHLLPLPQVVTSRPGGPQTAVANIRVRYSIKALRAVNIGSAVKAFQVESKGNVPCGEKGPCSPDGRWKAAIGSATLDAGPGNEFRNARVSCIAGPCPFTKIESQEFGHGGETFTVMARDWSDTATFLMEAEVFRSMSSDVVHESYPVKFGPALNFTLPGSAEGICITADVKGETIVYPLGPNLFLSWATCNARVNNDQTTVYRCELKPGYRFE
jgi:hypothetical protein